MFSFRLYHKLPQNKISFVMDPRLCYHGRRKERTFLETAPAYLLCPLLHYVCLLYTSGNLEWRAGCSGRRSRASDAEAASPAAKAASAARQRPKPPSKTATIAVPGAARPAARAPATLPQTSGRRMRRPRASPAPGTAPVSYTHPAALLLRRFETEQAAVDYLVSETGSPAEECASAYEIYRKTFD